MQLQDPFVSQIEGKWVVGGVKVYPVADNPAAVEKWETLIYTGDDLNNLSLLVTGPYKMKDIRLVQLQNGVGVFTRPQGAKGGRGKIGYTTVSRLQEITTQLLEDAPIIPGLFTDEEWGGVNEAHALDAQHVGVVGHIARYAVGREYYPTTFVFNTSNHSVFNQQIIAQRDCFPPTATKKPDTEKVLFSGGLKMMGEFATWYGGISDTSAGALPQIPNPFI